MNQEQPAARTPSAPSEAEMQAEEGWLERPIETSGWKLELSRIKHRAKLRYKSTLLLTLAITLLAVWWVWARRPFLESRIVLRVTESSFLEDKSSVLKGDLAEYLRDSAFRTNNLLPLIKKFQLYPLDMARGEAYALARLKDRYDVEVYKNYFLETGTVDGMRTARIAITFVDKDALVSFSVARALAQLVIDSETSRGTEESRFALDLLNQQFLKISELVKNNQEALSNSQIAWGLAKDKGKKEEAATLAVTVQSLKYEGEKLVLQQTEMRKQRDNQSLIVASLVSGAGTAYDIIDERPPIIPERRPGQLVIIGLAIFLFVLPVAGVAVGAFDTRIHDTEDLSRLGIPVAGRIGQFAGFKQGNLRERMRRFKIRRFGRV